MTDLEQAVIKTLCYADVFDYPLTAKEVQGFLIEKKAGKEAVVKALTSLWPTVQKKDEFFFLRGRDGLIKLRKNREKFAEKKRKIAVSFAKKAIKIPTVFLIGVTGALAMNNTKEDDDIDLFFITQKNRLWTSRLLVVMLAEALFTRRKPGDVDVRDKLCLNMFVDEAALSMEQKNLYIAHEICQMIPLAEKKKVYERFIKANLWTSSYLPNWSPKLYKEMP